MALEIKRLGVVQMHFSNSSCLHYSITPSLQSLRDAVTVCNVKAWGQLSISKLIPSFRSRSRFACPVGALEVRLSGPESHPRIGVRAGVGYSN